MKLKTLIAILIFLFISTSFAAEDVYKFKNSKQQHQFMYLISNFRCVVCQNQNLAESNAPLAADLRQQIYKKVLDNADNASIINYLVERYGHYILYQPPLNGTTIALWFGPAVILILMLSYLFYYIRRKHKESMTC